MVQIREDPMHIYIRLGGGGVIDSCQLSSSNPSRQTDLFATDSKCISGVHPVLLFWSVFQLAVMTQTWC